MNLQQQQNIIQNTAVSMESGSVNAQCFIQERLYDYLMQRKESKQIAPEKLMDLARRLAECLFRTATTEEEYMNLETLENRLHNLIKRLLLSNQNRQYQQQGNTSVSMMIPNPGQRNTVSMEPGSLKARPFLQERIYEYLMQQQQTQKLAPKKLMDIARHLEEGLFRTATTKEEYMNLETLENRLHNLIKRLYLRNRNQQYQHQGNYSVSLMIPTPGMPQSGNSIMVPSSDNSMVSPGNFLHNVSSNGGMITGYQQSTSNFFNNSGENSMISSMSAQRMASQMIPTPGFNSTNNTSNQFYMNIDSPNTTVDSSTVCHPLQQKQQVAGQNSRMLHSLASHIAGGGIRSSLHQEAYGFSNGSINNGLGMMGDNLPMMNSSGMQGRWHSRSQEAPHVLANVSEQNVQEEFSQRMSGVKIELDV